MHRYSFQIFPPMLFLLVPPFTFFSFASLFFFLLFLQEEWKMSKGKEGYDRKEVGEEMELTTAIKASAQLLPKVDMYRFVPQHTHGPDRDEVSRHDLKRPRCDVESCSVLEEQDLESR